ncbi:AraC family transcriptional regulator [Paenibacillus sp. CC-CFT747]|nr:AraC family transcriptional regulator [Paenibacillus sp. CC-CFT747]
MKLASRLNTVFYKLIISYSLLVLATTFTVGASFYFYYTSHYNDEVTKVAEQLLDYQRKITDETVFLKTENLYTGIVTNRSSNSDPILFLFDEPYLGNQAKISEAQRVLQNVVKTNSDLVQSIEVYFRRNRMTLSSTSGVTFLRPEDPVPLERWWKPAPGTNRSAQWVRELPPDADEADTLFIGSYPFNLPGNENKGLIAIHLKPGALYTVLQDSSRNTPGAVFVIDSAGERVTDSPDAAAPDVKLIGQVMESAADHGHFLHALDGVKTMVSYTTMGSNGWKLLNITAVDTFYKGLQNMQRVLVLVTLGAVLLGLAAAYMFTFRMYNPLRRVLEKTRSLFGETPPAPGSALHNEYAVLDHVIDNLSVKVTELESTLDVSRPLIQYNLVSSLLQGTIADAAELEERLKLLQLNMEGMRFTAVLFKLDSREFRRLSVENRQFVTYNLIKEMEKLSGAHSLWLAIEAPGSGIGIWAAAGAAAPDNASLYSSLRQIAEYACDNFTANPSISIGGWVDSPLELQRSRQQAEALMRYGYFLPEADLLTPEALLQREACGEALPGDWAVRLDKALRSASPSDVRSVLDEFATASRGGPFSAEACLAWTREAVAIFHRYVKDMHCSSSDVLSLESQAAFAELFTADQFVQWYEQAAAAAFRYLEERGANRHTEIIARVKAYIVRHLEEDLSLNLLADQVQLSPRYLGKLFKEETSMSFVDYVTEERMRKARDLIVSGSQTIEQIAEEVGFHSPPISLRNSRKRSA